MGISWVGTTMVEMVGAAGAVYTIFAIAEENLARKEDDTARELARSFLTTPTASRFSEQWNEAFREMFDGVFGKRHLSWRCFRRSFAQTTLVFLPAIAVFSRGYTGDVIVGNVQNIALFVLILNIGPDYISLLQTRGVLRWLKTRSAWTLALGIDLAGSCLILALSFGTFIALARIGVGDTFSEALLNTCTALLGLLLGLGDLLGLPQQWGSSSAEALHPVVAASILTSLLTSIWLWLFLAGSALIRAFNRTQRGAAIIGSYLRVEEAPIRAIGVVAALIVVALYLFVGGLRAVVSVVA